MGMGKCPGGSGCVSHGSACGESLMVESFDGQMEQVFLSVEQSVAAGGVED